MTGSLKISTCDSETDSEGQGIGSRSHVIGTLQDRFLDTSFQVITQTSVHTLSQINGDSLERG
jgi:hypothetical protein